MTRRKFPPPPVDPDDFGFDLVGNDWTSLAQERMCLVGLDSMARDLYYTCLRPFADPRTGDVRNCSYYRFIKLMTPSSSPRGGPRLVGPTLKQLRDALERLRRSGLVKLFTEQSRRDRVLKIQVVRRFGVASSRPVRAEVRAERGITSVEVNA